MKFIFRSLREKRKWNVLNLLPTILLGAEWVSFDWLWLELLFWEKQ